MSGRGLSLPSGRGFGYVRREEAKVKEEESLGRGGGTGESWVGVVEAEGFYVCGVSVDACVSFTGMSLAVCVLSVS